MGIGAMRSGTTWLTDLLCHHSHVSLALNDKKEQWLLNRVATGQTPIMDYLQLFPRDGLLRGEWSPRYMWLLHSPSAAAQLPSDTQFFCALRDPLERYASHQRFAARRRNKNPSLRWTPAVAAGLGTWLGLYADQLHGWRRTLGDRLHVFSYEAAVEDPFKTCETLWVSLGLSPQPLSQDIVSRRHGSTNGIWEWPPGLRESLRHLYTPQLQRLEDWFGLDTSAWTALNGVD